MNLPVRPTFDAPFIHLLLPDGSCYHIRTETSGIVFNVKTKFAVDDELAIDMLLVKRFKFIEMNIQGTA